MRKHSITGPVLNQKSVLKPKLSSVNQMASPKPTGGYIPLANAAWHFAPVAWKSTALAVRAEPRSKVTVKRFATIPENSSQNLERLLNLVDEAVNQLRSPYEATSEMRSRLLAGLCTGKFRAVGFETKPTVAKSPKAIPKSIFENQPKITWAKNTVESLGHRFEGIKIERSQTASKAQTAPNRSARGRPAVRPDIIRAVQMADRANGKFRALARKQQIQEIQPQLISINSAKYGKKLPSDRTIAKWIPKAFELPDSTK